MANTNNTFEHKTPFYTFTLASKMPFYGCDRNEYSFSGRDKHETINRMMQFANAMPGFNKSCFDISVHYNVLIGEEPNYDNDPETKCKILTLSEDFSTWIAKNLTEQTAMAL